MCPSTSAGNARPRLDRAAAAPATQPARPAGPAPAGAVTDAPRRPPASVPDNRRPRPSRGRRSFWPPLAIRQRPAACRGMAAPDPAFHRPTAGADAPGIATWRCKAVFTVRNLSRSRTPDALYPQAVDNEVEKSWLIDSEDSSFSPPRVRKPEVETAFKSALTDCATGCSCRDLAGWSGSGNFVNRPVKIALQWLRYFHILHL